MESHKTMDVIAYPYSDPGPLLIHWADGYLTARPCEVSEPRYCMLQWSYRSKIWHLGSAAAEVPVKIQSDCESLNTNLTALGLRDNLQYDVRPLCE